MKNIKLVGDNIKEGGRNVGRLSGQYIKDSNGRTIARIDGDNIKDGSGRTIGRLNGSYLKDSGGRTLVKMDDIRKSIDGGIGGTTLAAIWLLFVR